jgi:hypothetical protein
MALSEETDMVKLIKQVNRPGLYVSDIINDRYQILGSEAFKGAYFVYDLVKDDMIRRRDGGCNYLDSLDAAMDVVNGLGPVAKTAKVKQPKPEKVKKPKTAKAASDGKGRAGSKLTFIRDLIRKGGTDVDVFKLFREQYPSSTYSFKTVSILRKDMGLA